MDETYDLLSVENSHVQRYADAVNNFNGWTWKNSFICKEQLKEFFIRYKEWPSRYVRIRCIKFLFYLDGVVDRHSYTLI